MAKIHGELIKAQLENSLLAQDAAVSALGLVYLSADADSDGRRKIKYASKSSVNTHKDTLLTESANQVITNKDIDGGTAKDSSRLTLPKGSTATLAALTRKAGTVIFNSDDSSVYVDDGMSLSPLGGSWLVKTHAAEGAQVPYYGRMVLVYFNNTGAASLTSTPIQTSDVADGAVLRLVGSSNAFPVSITGESTGVIINGDISLSRGSMIELQYISYLSSWVEVTRNMIAGA